MAAVRYVGRAVGRVQGVGFRMFVKQQADEMDVTGWVKNMPDGSVTMEVQAEEDVIRRLAEKIRKGSGFIRVDSLTLDPVGAVPDEHHFDIRY